MGVICKIMLEELISGCLMYVHVMEMYTYLYIVAWDKVPQTDTLTRKVKGNQWHAYPVVCVGTVTNTYLCINVSTLFTTDLSS